MADLQKYFEKFNQLIRLNRFEENAELREKRDMLVKELRENLGADVPGFEPFNQGSYAMNTGVRPKDGNYDIDVGLIFDCEPTEFPDPVALKVEVKKAIERHNRTVRIRRACVTVEYLRDGEVDYHVDLALYAKRPDGVGLDLAAGRESSGPEKRKWEQNDPKGLIDAITGRFADEQAGQMRRTIRYLKRWRDHKFTPGTGPISVLLTIATFLWLTPQIDYFEKKPDDLAALIALLKRILAQFISSIDNHGSTVRRLVVRSPVVPREDLLAGTTDAQMATLYSKLEELRNALELAAQEPLPEKACAILAKQFGDEFPVPSPDETAKTVRKPYVTSGQSA
jgi:hypothetical protein